LRKSAANPRFVRRTSWRSFGVYQFIASAGSFISLKREFFAAGSKGL
jgi:hypothetical protein